MKQVQSNLKISHDDQKSHANLKKTLNEFQVGEHVFAKIKPRKSSFKLGSCAKLAPRYCGPFEILARVGPVAYQLGFPTNPRIQIYFILSTVPGC